MTGSPVPPLSDKPALLVHSCDGCGGTLLLDPDKGWSAAELQHANNTFGVYIYCKTCQAEEDRREAAVTVQPNTRCTHRAYPGGPFSDLYVVSVASRDYVTALDGTEYEVKVPPLVAVGVLGFNGVLPARVAELEAHYWPPEMRGLRAFPRTALRMKGL